MCRPSPAPCSFLFFGFFRPSRPFDSLPPSTFPVDRSPPVISTIRRIPSLFSRLCAPVGRNPTIIPVSTSRQPSLSPPELGKGPLRGSNQLYPAIDRGGHQERKQDEKQEAEKEEIDREQELPTVDLARVLDDAEPDTDSSSVSPSWPATASSASPVKTIQHHQPPSSIETFLRHRDGNPVESEWAGSQPRYRPNAALYPLLPIPHCSSIFRLATF
ncbi:hypothetical protein CSUB01_06573 [Colletotrichum sublineola]|uniref:Uncharacterized protein n=1 Tax=Colletotrichum sublineola TaxID=1173701 RepID=A0A066XD37_COLSU|nr:hypothetical protein CSUB01_06573 [Colletotrichum sublineola]